MSMFSLFITILRLRHLFQILVFRLGKDEHKNDIFFFTFQIYKDYLEIKIETYHIADRGDKDNVHQLPPEKLKVR